MHPRHRYHEPRHHRDRAAAAHVRARVLARAAADAIADALAEMAEARR